MNNYYVYDIETYPNCFTCSILDYQTGDMVCYEISDRYNHARELIAHITRLANTVNAHMVGYNNLGFDYPIVHEFVKSDGMTGYTGAYALCQRIIRSQESFQFMVPHPDHIVQQIDLFKIHHFDNQARRTSLKQIEFNMRTPHLQDLPFPPGTYLTHDQIDTLIHYNMFGDVANTAKFLGETLKAIEFRMTFGSRWLNYNDTKIGKMYFIQQLEKAGIQCYKPNGEPMQTKRGSIRLRDALLPTIHFNLPAFQRIHAWFWAQTIVETKGVFNDVNCTINGFKYDFGLGGIHGSVESQTVYGNDDYIIEDWDVASYYPNIAIANNLYPEHLGEKFCAIYQDVYNQRKQHAKGTPQNAAMKLALNGVYGDSNNQYSPFYDPLYTMRITINGQLLLCMLTESLLTVPTLSMVQINTDGLTIRYHRSYQSHVHNLCREWEHMTRLTLESAEYSRMHIRDVNNYIALKPDGSVKRKGAYEYEREHHQNWSAMVIPKAAEQVLIHNRTVEEAVYSNNDIYDYLIFKKAPQFELVFQRGNEKVRVPQQGRSRYYVSTVGGTLVATKPPPEGKQFGDYKKANGVSEYEYAQRNMTGIYDPAIHNKKRSVYTSQVSEAEKGWLVTMANDISQCVNPINYEYYLERVRRLVEPVR